MLAFFFMENCVYYWCILVFDRECLIEVCWRILEDCCLWLVNVFVQYSEFRVQ